MGLIDRSTITSACRSIGARKVFLFANKHAHPALEQIGGRPSRGWQDNAPGSLKQIRGSSSEYWERWTTAPETPSRNQTYQRQNARRPYFWLNCFFFAKKNYYLFCEENFEPNFVSVRLTR